MEGGNLPAAKLNQIRQPCQLLFSCLTFSVYDSGTKFGQFGHPVELPPRQSKATSQMFQMLEAARSDEGQRHFRFFLRD